MTDNTKPNKSDAKGGERFFYLFAVSSLIVVIAGFAGRAGTLPHLIPPITPTLIAHIIAMMLWYIFVPVQAGLMARNNTSLHMKLGKFSIIGAFAVLLMGTLVTLETYTRRVNDNVIGAEFAVYLSFSSLLGFGILYTLAFVHRHSASHHKRYIIMAGTAMLLAATFRLAAAFGAPQPVPMGIVIQYGFITALMFYDLKHHERFHRATMISMFVCIMLTVGIYTLGSSALWADFIKASLL